jgi:chloride channel 3/4/5
MPLSLFHSSAVAPPQIKDSSRIFKLRKRKSLRGRIGNAIDRSLGWVVVTIVGFMAAVLAFAIVRSEHLLFDLKEGHCTQGWYTAQWFCCSVRPAASKSMGAGEDTCEHQENLIYIIVRRQII